jgi:hypothetical protein
MVIVSLMRGDLRHEFDMADEAFALSPLSARAALPSEEDYEAISHAFMETSRGRWFLGEYAKRNRNADTRMVLDAVARIEQTVAAQREQVSDNRLAEAVAAIRRAVYEAQVAAAAALDGMALEQNLAPVHKGARIIKEISWRWREIGADARICDLLDSQVGAIEDACGQISSVNPGVALSAAFDLIKERIADFDESEAAAPPAVESASPDAAPPDGVPAAAVETVKTVSRTNNAEGATDMPADTIAEIGPVTVTLEAADVTAEGPAMATGPGDAASQGSEPSPEAEEPFDDALLDMIALEMAAPQPEDSGDILHNGHEIHAAEPSPAEPIIVAEAPRPMAAPAVAVAVAEPPALLTSLQRLPQPARQPFPGSSLGSSLIANGIIRKPQASPTDALAPIRRMSQAEKIAFFS